MRWCHYFMVVTQSTPVRSQIVRYIVRCVFVKDYILLTFVDLGIVQTPKRNSVVKAYSHLQATKKYTPQLNNLGRSITDKM